MTKAREYDITIDAGATFSRTLTFSQNDSAFDFTGYSNPRSQVRKTPRDDAFTAFSVSIDSDPTTGILRWTMDDSDTLALAAEGQRFYYDLLITNRDSEEEKYLFGEATVRYNVTR